MSEFEVEDGVPIPPWAKGRTMPRSPLRIAVESLEIGQSIFVPKVRGIDLSRTKSRVTTAGQNAKLTFPSRKFSVRLHEKDGVSGARIWRTK